jgi:uncharacterized membrane protein YkvA (DUF1232 family)
MAGWLKRLSGLKRETLVLYYAVRDPRTPLIAKIIAGAVVAYALSPIDLIPDFIPVLGLLDDLIIVPLGIALCFRLIPEPVIVESRLRAAALAAKPKSYAAAAVIVLIWVIVLGLVAWGLYGAFA